LYRPMSTMLAMFLASAGAYAGSLPNLVGTWSGPFKTAILGNDLHYPGNETVIDPPRVRQIEFTVDIEGQDGRVVWGNSWSDPERKEAFVATITADGKRLLGADSDGSIDADISNPEFIDFCSTQTGLRSHAIIASCGQIKRPK
jgi:hypothetical protein